MGHPTLKKFDSIDAIRQAATQWDCLWEQSVVTMPTARAELVANWIEQFAMQSQRQLWVVEQDGRFVGALPLSGRRIRSVLPVGDLTWNYWAPNGELLLDPSCDIERVSDLLAGVIDESPWPLLWFDLVPFEMPHWQALSAAFARRNLPIDVHPRYQIGQIALEGTFETYMAARSKSLRRSLRKDTRRLETSGPLELSVYDRFTPNESDRLLRRALEVEDKSWKQSGGTTILRTPGMFDFYRHQARRLAEWGFLRIAFLEQQGEPIAFEVGWIAKGVYHSFKVGYDQGYRAFGPGHLLRHRLIERLFDDDRISVIDFQGPLSDALASWSTRSYPIGRMVISPRRVSSRAIMVGYRTASTLVRRWRRR